MTIFVNKRDLYADEDAADISEEASRVAKEQVEKFNPAEGSEETKSQMLKIILLREVRAASSEKDLRRRIRAVMDEAYPPSWEVVADRLVELVERQMKNPHTASTVEPHGTHSCSGFCKVCADWYVDANDVVTAYRKRKGE
jgi:hypothetical protein